MNGFTVCKLHYYDPHLLVSCELQALYSLLLIYFIVTFMYFPWIHMFLRSKLLVICQDTVLIYVLYFLWFYYSLDSEFLASTSIDGSARIWKSDGVPVTSLTRGSVCFINLVYECVFRVVTCFTKNHIYFKISAGWENWTLPVFKRWDKTISILYCSKRHV